MWRCIKINSSLQGLAYKAWSMYRMSRSLIYLLNKLTIKSSTWVGYWNTSLAAGAEILNEAIFKNSNAWGVAGGYVEGSNWSMHNSFTGLLIFSSAPPT